MRISKIRPPFRPETGINSRCFTFHSHMALQLQQTHSESITVARRPALRRAYVFAFASCAILLLGFVLFRPNEGGFVASAKFAIPLDTQSEHNANLPSSTKAIADAMRDRIHVEQALASVRQRTAASRHSPKLPPDADVNLAREAIEVVASANQSPAEKIVEVRFTGASETEAALLVDHLVSDFVAHWEDELSRQAMLRSKMHDHARIELESCRKEELTARATLDDFARRHFDSVKSALTVAQTTAPQADTLRPVENPEWLRRNGKLAELKRLREQLLVDRTAEHPQIRDLSLSIQQLEEELRHVGRYLPPERSSTRYKPQTVSRGSASNPNSAAISTNSQLEQITSTIATAAETYDQLSSEYESVRHRRERLEQDVERMVRKSEQSNKDANVRIVERAHLIERPESMSVSFMLLVAAIAISGGAALAWLVGARRSANTFGSASDVEQALSLPAFGTLSAINGKSGSATTGPSPAFVRNMNRGSEVALMVFVAAFTTAADGGHRLLAVAECEQMSVLADAAAWLTTIIF